MVFFYQKTLRDLMFEIVIVLPWTKISPGVPR